METSVYPMLGALLKKDNSKIAIRSSNLELTTKNFKDGRMS